MKKIILVSALAGAMLAGPLAASAFTFSSYNYTTTGNNVSIKGSQQESSYLPGASATNPTSHQLAWGLVKLVCGQLTGTCTADVIVNQSAFNTGGTSIGQMSLDLTAAKVTPSILSGVVNGNTYTVTITYDKTNSPVSSLTCKTPTGAAC